MNFLRRRLWWWLTILLLLMSFWKIFRNSIIWDFKDFFRKYCYWNWNFLINILILYLILTQNCNLLIIHFVIFSFNSLYPNLKWIVYNFILHFFFTFTNFFYFIFSILFNMRSFSLTKWDVLTCLWTLN